MHYFLVLLSLFKGFIMKLASVIFLVFVILLTFSCKENVREPKSKIVRTKSLNPNGDSELAILMREMLAHSKYIKQRLEDGLAEQEAYPESQERLLTAKATTLEKRGYGFDAYANAYLAALQELHKPNGMRIYNHNNLVSKCVDCHKSFCTGPIPTIEKLFISND